MSNVGASCLTLCCLLLWTRQSLGQHSPFSDNVPLGTCTGETPHFEDTLKLHKPAEFEPAYLHAGIQATPGALPPFHAEQSKDMTVPSTISDGTLMNLNFPDGGYPSAMFNYTISGCQHQWTNDYFCDSVQCTCPYKYGEWTAVVADPTALAQAGFSSLSVDEREAISETYENLVKNRAYGTSGEWDLISISVYRPESKMAVRFNYKKSGDASKGEYLLAVSIPIKVAAGGEESGLVNWMKAVMGDYAGRCSELATTAAPIVETTTPATGESQMTIISTDEFQYQGKCLTGEHPDGQDKGFRRNARRECKMECMTENTEGEVTGGTERGSSCTGFSYREDPQGTLTGNNCIIHQEKSILGRTAPAMAEDALWECWEMKTKTSFEHQRTDQNIGTPANLPVTSEIKNFNVAFGLDGGYMARRYKIQAIPQAGMNYFNPYIWIEIEGEDQANGIISRRLAEETWIPWGTFRSREVTSGTTGYVPVSQAEWAKLETCIAPTGAKGTPAHVVTTERICVDTQSAGHCIREVLELTCIWIALLVGLIAFLIGRYCCQPKPDGYGPVEILVKKASTGAGAHPMGSTVVYAP